MATRLAVGDRVRVLGHGTYAGREGSVAQVNPATYYVNLDAIGNRAAQRQLFYPSTLLKLAATAPQAPPAPAARALPPIAVPARQANGIVTDYATAPAVSYFVPTDVRRSLSAKLRADAFAAHGGKDLYLDLPEAAYANCAPRTVHGDHMAIDCVVAVYALNRTFAGSTRTDTNNLYKDTVCEATKAAITQPQFLNPTHVTVNTGPKKSAIDDALASIARGDRKDHCDVSKRLQESYRDSPRFTELLSEQFGRTHLTRSKVRVYAENTAQAISDHAPEALREVRIQLGNRVSPVDGLFDAYVRNLERLLETMGVVD